MKIYKEEGMRAFYRGYVSTIAGVIPYAGVSFFTYDTLKQIYKGKRDIFNNEVFIVGLFDCFYSLHG